MQEFRQLKQRLECQEREMEEKNQQFNEYI